MICRPAQFRKPLAIFLLTLLTATLWAEPDAAAILEAARLNPLGEKIALTAELSNARGPKKVPFKIVVDGAVRYQFTDPDQELILEMTEDEARLTERVGGKSAPVRPARFDESVRGSGLTYEDLSLQFLYWKDPKIIGEESIRTFKAWKMEIQAPRGGASQYGVARIWIDQKNGALLRVEGYNMQGKLIRRFEMVSVQKLEGQWMLKNMRVEVIDPETKKRAISNLSVTGKAE